LASDVPIGAQINKCLEIARGQWITTFDDRDLMHPARLERLLAAAERESAEIICDNVLTFDEDNRSPPALAVTGKFAGTPTRIDVANYLDLLAPGLFGPTEFSFRPLIRLQEIRDGAVLFDPELNANLEFELCLRLLLRGANFLWDPEITLFHRRAGRDGSPGRRDPGLTAILEKHRDAVRVASVRDRDPDALRRNGWDRAAALVSKARQTIPGSWMRSKPAKKQPSQAGSGSDPKRSCPGPDHQAAGKPARHVCIISRQRLVGRTNGSSTYLIGLATAVASRGMRVHLVCPSPTLFGRVPAFVLRPEMAIFDTIDIRGSIRIGNFIACVDPRVAMRAAAAMAGKLLQKMGVNAERLNRPAPYSVNLPWQIEDFLFVSRHARAHADAIMVDYAFQTVAIPYVLRPEAPTAIVMHDLISSREAAYGPLGVSAADWEIDFESEMKILARADAVLAIQAAEASIVRQNLPLSEVIVAPLAAMPVAAAQPGSGCALLFVASKTTANIDALDWFIHEVWPIVIKAVPSAQLLVAGGVGAMFPSVPAGIQLLGQVPDLTPLYAKAAAIISPLRGGSGLKIKLVEAMAQGKAIVATTTTLQGVEDVAGPAVAVADDAEGFAAAVIGVLGDEKLRTRYAEAALAVARSRFSAEACYAEFLDFLERPVVRARSPQAATAI
jgi:succinoglycan biosynthesis protein ExoO